MHLCLKRQDQVAMNRKGQLCINACSKKINSWFTINSANVIENSGHKSPFCVKIYFTRCEILSKIQGTQEIFSWQYNVPMMSPLKTSITSSKCCWMLPQLLVHATTVVLSDWMRICLFMTLGNRTFKPWRTALVPKYLCVPSQDQSSDRQQHHHRHKPPNQITRHL